MRYGFTKDNFPLAMLVYGDEATNGFIQFNRAIYSQLQFDSLQKKIFVNIRPKLADGSSKYTWLDDSRYQDEDSLYILYRLAIAFNENETSDNAKSFGPDRLQFYYEHHRLSALIEYIKEGRLSITEAAQYDKFEADKIPPRMLPRLLAGDLDEGITLTKAQIVAYDLHDYEPKNNPHRHELLTKEAFSQIHPGNTELWYSAKYEEYTNADAKYTQYLEAYIDTVLQPVVAERARLYLDLQRLKKQEQELGPGPLTWPQWFYYLFYKTPTEECVLVSAKIALLSGALEGMHQVIRVEQNKMNYRRITGGGTLKSGEAESVAHANFLSDQITPSYITANSYPDEYTLYANGNYLKENFGCNAIENTRFSIKSRQYLRSSLLDKPSWETQCCNNIVMLKEEDTEPTYCDKGIIKIKTSSVNPEKISVYWTEDGKNIKKTFKSSAFDGALENLPKPGESTADASLRQKISATCDYCRNDRWITRERPTINSARDHVATFFKGLIGAIFYIPAGIIGLGCPSFANSYNSTFFGTHSFNCLKQVVATRETLAKQKSV